MEELGDRQQRYEKFYRLVSAIASNRESLEQLKRRGGGSDEERIYEQVIDLQLRLLAELKEKNTM